MSKINRYTAAEVCEACEGTGGVKAEVARKLGCSRQTVCRYARRYVTVREALHQADEALTDRAEVCSARKIDDGYWPAIRYRLETKGRDRGYVQRIEQQQIGEVQLRIEYVNDWRPRDSASPQPASGAAGSETAIEAVQLAERGAALEEDDAGNGDSN